MEDFQIKKIKKKFTLYEDKKINSNKDNEDDFWWDLITAIPNGIKYVFNESVKYCNCKKKKKKNSQYLYIKINLDKMVNLLIIQIMYTERI